MTQEDLEALLGRPLTPIEVENLDLYLEIAEESLEDLLCTNITKEDDATRVFEPRENYHTVWTGVFRNITSVKVGGETLETDAYYPTQFDSKNGSWFNSIVFDSFPKGEVEVTADWGFDPYPADLKRLLAQLFANTSKAYTNSGVVTEKQVEDFRIRFAEDSGTDDENFIDSNRRVINKYSLCDVQTIRHGDIKANCYYGYRRIFSIY
jgi:hypothetical protein